MAVSVNKELIFRRHILVKVKAAGVNRADILQRQGSYPPPPGESTIIGLEMYVLQTLQDSRVFFPELLFLRAGPERLSCISAGVVEKTGSDVTEWKVGDRVMALVGGGAYAEHATVMASHAMAIPKNLSFEEAAAIPEAFLTAFQSVFYIGGLKDHQKALIHAGASGVGTAAIQLVSLLNDAQAYVTAGSNDKIAYCKEIGASDGANYKQGPWLPKIKEVSDGGVHLVLDCVGRNYFSDNLEVLKDEGKLILIGFMSGHTLPEGVSLSPILRKKLTIQGTTLRSRSAEYKTELTHKLQEFVKDAFETGKLKPIVAKVFDWNNVAEAHQYMEASQNIGKIILNGM